MNNIKLTDVFGQSVGSMLITLKRQYKMTYTHGFAGMEYKLVNIKLNDTDTLLVWSNNCIDYMTPTKKERKWCTNAKEVKEYISTKLDQTV